MKETEKEEVKKIVEETIKEEKETAKEEIKKEKGKKKKTVIIATIICIVLLGLAALFFFLFIFKPTYKVTLNTGGGVITKNIVIEDNIVKEMPEITPPNNMKLVTWINKNKEAVRPGLELSDDDTWDPVFREDGETVTLHFSSGTDEVIPDIVIIKGSEVILPAPPKNYKDWKFLFWVYHDDYVVIEGTKIYQDTNIEAYWWKPAPDNSKEEVTIKYDTGTDEKLEPVTVVKGSKYIFKTPTKQKEGKKFKGWLDESGNLLTSESTVEKDITLKAKWVEPYTCPDNCTPSEDGKTCTKTTVAAPSEETICEGTEYNGYCVDSNNISDIDCVRQCSDGEPFGDTEVSLPVPSRYIAEYDTYSEICCAKKIDRVTRYTCPAGYERDGDNCKLVETINCTQN